MNFWATFAIEEALSVVQALLASGKIGGNLTPAQIAAMEAWISQTEALLGVL